MDFSEIFREKYRVALTAARANDQDGVVAGLSNLYLLFEEQYKKNNGDSIVIKAKLSYWQDTFGSYIQIIKKYGLQDRRIQKFFGLIEDESIPAFTDILRGQGGIPVPSEQEKKPKREIDIDGILPPSDSAERPVDKVPTEEIAPILKEEKKPEPIAPATPEIPMPSVGSDAMDKPTDEKPVYTPDSLSNFIGQEHIKKVLRKEIAIAKNEGRKHLDNILLLGNPGLGKTTLLKLIAKELGVKFELLDCSQFRNSQQSLKALQTFFMRIARDNEPVVIALDEIHMLNKELQSSLLTLLNDREYVSPLDINGNSRRIPIDEFTFIAATTDDQDIIPTIKNRCLRLTFQMKDYSYEELKQIYKNKVAAKGLTITEGAVDMCIPRSRGAIRYVNAIVEGLNSALYNDDGIRISTHIDIEVAYKYFEENGIDPMGLGPKDLEILKVIQDAPNGIISADVLSARVGLEPQKYMSEYEKYLIKIKFVDVTNRGRSLTEKAINYLKGEK